jgi:glyoxylase-like metal-dependent hydrolase (beta-lactamase superfamily II)
VHPLKTAEMPAPPAFFNRPPGPLWQLRALMTRERIWLPIPAFLVEHPGAGPFLVDAGMHPEAIHDRAGHMGRPNSLIFRLRMSEEQAVPAQLRERGIDPAAIGLVVMTHLHHDHVSGVTQFPKATFVVDEREWMAAASGNFTGGYHRPQIDHPFDWRTVDLDRGDVDLFGDGSVRMVPTRGHSAGHTSIVLRLSGGRELMLVGDAV